MTAIARTHVCGVLSFHLKEPEMPFARFSLIRKRIGDSPQCNVALRRSGNAAILPKIRAQNLPGTNACVFYVSIHVHFYLICCLIIVLFLRLCSRIQVL